MRDFLMTLIKCSGSMSVLALFLIVLTPILSKRYASKWLYYVWLVIVAGLIIPFRLHFDTALIRINAIPLTVQQVLPENIRNFADTTTQIGAVNQGLLTIPRYQVVGTLWLAGVVSFLICHGLRHYRFVRMVRRWGEQVNDPQLLGTLQRIKKDMRIAKQVKLQICSCVSSPMMIGFLNPVILLPKSDFSSDELPYILRHELVHFKRKDLWYKSLVILATAIHWFNPVVYLMAKVIASQCEISCDAEVVNETDMDSRQRYSETILGVIKSQSRMQTAFSTNFYGGKKAMQKRIFSIMDTTKKRAGVVVLCLILMGTLGTGIAFAANKDVASDKSIAYKKIYPAESFDNFDNVEWYTYDEFKAFVDEQKKSLPNCIGARGGYYDENGVLHEEVWTQEKVDETLAQYEQILEDIKNGGKFSKSVNGDEAVGYSAPKLNISTSAVATIDLENGETIDFGPYDTKEECYAAVKAYCDEQVKAGKMTQQEADEILSKYK